MDPNAVKNLPTHSACAPVKSPSLPGGSVAIASSEMWLPYSALTLTAPSGKALFAAAYRRASSSSAASASPHPRLVKDRLPPSGSAATRLMAGSR